MLDACAIVVNGTRHVKPLAQKSCNSLFSAMQRYTSIIPPMQHTGTACYPDQQNEHHHPPKVAGKSTMLYLTETIDLYNVLRFRQATEENNFGKIVKFGAIAEDKNS